MNPIWLGCGCILDIFYYLGAIVFLAGVVWAAERLGKDRYRD